MMVIAEPADDQHESGQKYNDDRLGPGHAASSFIRSFDAGFGEEYGLLSSISHSYDPYCSMVSIASSANRS